MSLYRDNLSGTDEAILLQRLDIIFPLLPLLYKLNTCDVVVQLLKGAVLEAWVSQRATSPQWYYMGSCLNTAGLTYGPHNSML